MTNNGSEWSSTLGLLLALATRLVCSSHKKESPQALFCCHVSRAFSFPSALLRTWRPDWALALRSGYGYNG
jgi:hypothetical protein